MSLPNSNYPYRNLSIPYSSLTPLNTLDVHFPAPSSDNDTSKLWIIYIHGGAWRDPLKTSTSISATLKHLDPTKLPIAGIASLNYRLSPYPSHPTHPSHPQDKSRNAKHPDHIKDIVRAIRWLQKEYKFGKRYVLVGHSCGATLAMQVAMGVWNTQGFDEEENGKREFEMPAAAVGVAGIYDMRLLRDNFLNIPVYEEFIKAAFGESEEEWDRASPTTGSYAKSWPKAQVLILAHSKEDELVDWAQVEAMEKSLKKQKKDERSDEVLELKGKHDEIWGKGTEMARAIETALKMLAA